MKMTVFWVFALCSLVEVYRRFSGACFIALIMEAASTSETSVNFYQTTRRNNPEDSHLQRGALSSLLFRFTLEYAITNVQGTHQKYSPLKYFNRSA
jgi:hypothetical protein